MPDSRQRAFLRDLARGLAQQMVFWGCDARHPRGNLLVAAGMRRLARSERGAEGSSRYRAEWLGGLIELHSYCAGWSSARSEAGCLFVRANQSWLAPRGIDPVTPGHYEQARRDRTSSDALLTAVRPLVAWVVEYESRVATLGGPTYRAACWGQLRRGPEARPWLPPAEATRCFHQFLDAPTQVVRPRDLNRNLAMAGRPKEI